MFKKGVILLTFLALSTGIHAEESEEFIPPKLLTMPSLTLPDSLAQQEISGTITATLLVDETGNVERVTIDQPLHPALDSLVKAEVLTATFSAGMVDEEPVAAEISFEFPFSLQEKVQQLAADTTCIGTITRRGTRDKLSDIPVALTFTADDALPVPLETFLEFLGSLPGQERDGVMIITTSNDMGQFVFQGIPNGSFTLKMIQTGYLPFEITDTIVEGKTVDLTCYLRPRLQDDYEVITYYSDEPEHVSRRQINRKEAASVPGTGGDPLRAIHSLPGVARPAYGTGDIIIRGARPEDSRYYVDNMELPRIFHDIEVRSVLHPEALAGIDFYPGAYGAQFGNVTGGVVVAESRTSDKKRFSGSVDITVMDMGLYLEAPITEQLSIAGSYRTFDRTGFVDWYVETAMDDNTIVPRYYDYMGRIDLKDVGKSSFSLQVLGSKDSVDVTTPGADKESSFFNRVQAQWRLRLSDKLTNDLSYGFLYHREAYQQDWDYQDSLYYLSFFEDNTFKTYAHFFNEQITAELSDKVTLKGGISGDIRGLKRDMDSRFLYQGEIWEEDENDSIVFIPGSDTTYQDSFSRHETSYDYGTVSPWLQMIWQVSDPLLLVGGIRYDYYKELRHSGAIVPEYGKYNVANRSGVSGEPSFRVASRLKLNDKHTIKAALGNYNQTPEPRVTSIDSIWGNPQLPTTKAAHYTTGYEWQITDLLSLDVQGYYNKRWDIPEWATYAEIESTGVRISPNMEGRSYGLEVFLRHLRSEHFAGWLAYTLSRSEETDSSGTFKPTWFDQTHNFMILGSWYLPRHWEIGAKLQLTSGVRYTPVQGIDPTDRSPIEGDPYSERTNPACKLDLRVAKQLLSKRVTTTIYADVQNVLYPIYKSPEEKSYNYQTGELEEYYMAPIPMVGVLVQF